ncbi:MAG: hypothetical protein ACJAS9_003909, partial [Polaribacter sp.]
FIYSYNYHTLQHNKNTNILLLLNISKGATPNLSVFRQKKGKQHQLYKKTVKIIIV